MAKRPSKKKASKKVGKKKVAKAPARKGRAPQPNPAPVSTGRGPGPAEIGAQLVDMFNRGQFDEIERRFWASDVVSCEGVGVHMEWRGIKAVRDKNSAWMREHRIVSARAEALYVGSTGFAVRYAMDVETIATGERKAMPEIGVYTVRDGRIVREEFMYQV